MFKKSALTISIVFLSVMSTMAQSVSAARFFSAGEKEIAEYIDLTGHEEAQRLLNNLSFEEYDKGSVVRGRIKGIDGEIRPYFVRVPVDYDPGIKKGLLVYLHGGLGRETAINTASALASESLASRIADDTGCILLVPAGDLKGAWWGYTGLTNLSALIKLTKRRFNIDDDRVHLMGYSDGGSGVYAMTMFSGYGFGGCVVINGHPAAGGGDKLVDLYPVNMSNGSFLVIMSRDDALFPPGDVDRLLDVFREAGAGIRTVVLEGEGHIIKNLAAVAEAAAEFILSNPRKPPRELTWEHGGAGTGDKRHRWLRIDSIGKQGPEKKFNKFFVKRNTAGKVEFNREMFHYNGPSGRVHSKILENVIEIQTENVTGLSVYIDPGLVDTGKTVTVKVNGEVKYQGKPEFSSEESLGALLGYFDRKDVYFNKITVTGL